MRHFSSQTFMAFIFRVRPLTWEPVGQTSLLYNNIVNNNSRMFYKVIQFVVDICQMFI